MEDALVEQFIKGYKTDKKYAVVIDDLIAATAEGSGDVFSKPGLLFVLVNKLLYHVKPNSLRALYMLYVMTKTILSTAHDKKHHFSKDRMFYDLSGLSIHRKTRHISDFVDHCPQCNLNSTDRNPVIGNYQPIRLSDTLPMRIIAMDFIVGLPAVPATGSAWQIPNHNSFNALLTVSYKSSKRSLLIPGHTTYTAQEWGRVLMRQLLLSDWGVLTAIISDRDCKFTSEFWQGMWEALGTKLMMTAAYHP